MENLNENIETGFLGKFSEEDLRKLAIIFQAVKIEPAAPCITLGEFSKEYLTYMRDKGYSQAYINSSEFTLNKIIKYLGTSKNLSEVDIRCAEKFIYSLQTKAPRGTANYLRNLRVIFNKAVEWEYISSNVFKKITLPKKQKIDPEFMGLREVELICSLEPIQTLKDIFLFSFYTGARLSEVLNITWKDIDLNEMNIYIGRSYITKSRKPRTVPICTPLYDILTRRKAEAKIIELETAYFFKQRNGDRYKADFVSKSFLRARRKANLSKGIHFHTLRHSFASNLVARGNSIYVVKELLGHASVTMTEIYSHLKTEDLRKAVNSLNW